MTWGKIATLAAVATLAAAACSSAPHTTPLAAQGTPAATPTATATRPPQQLTNSTSVTRKHPVDGTKVGVIVSTVPGARIIMVAHFETGDRRKTAHADTVGAYTFWLPAGSITGYRVRVVVRVSAHGQERTSRVWFTPRQPPPPPAPKPAPVPSSAPAPPPPPSGCYPKASSGNCYEPGEFCPEADAGMSGVAGDGEAIICENNNSLRWEPA